MYYLLLNRQLIVILQNQATLHIILKFLCVNNHEILYHEVYHN